MNTPFPPFFLTLLPLPTIEEVLNRKPVPFNNQLFNNIISTMANAGFVAADKSTWFLGANWKKQPLDGRFTDSSGR